MPHPLPPLHCPYPAALHPGAGAAETAALAWADRFGLAADRTVRDRFARTRAGRLAGRTSPHATPAGLQACADWQTWLFLFDDACCDESDLGRSPARTAELGAMVFRVLESGRRDPAGPHRPFLDAFAELCERLRGLSSAGQFARFAAAVSGFLIALGWEAVHRETGAAAGLAEYTDLRRHSGGVPTCLALIEIADGFRLPQAAREDPDLVELEVMVADIICWGNDVLSFPTERQRSVDVLSLPVILARDSGLGVESALKEAAMWHDDRMREFALAERRLRARADEPLSRYVDGLCHWVSGNLAWSYETGRYGLDPRQPEPLE